MKHIKAIPQIIHGIRFDSQLEAEAYRMLCCKFGRNAISCHFPVIYSADKRYNIPSLSHKIDFVIRDKDGLPVRYLEIKGKISGTWHGKREYIRTLIILEKIRPNIFDKYVVWVGNGSNILHPDNESCSFMVPFPKNIEEIEGSLFL